MECSDSFSSTNCIYAHQPKWHIGLIRLYKKEERSVLAIKSREAAPKFGNPERQQLIDEIHDYMLSKAPPVPQLIPAQAADENAANKDGESQVSPQSADVHAATEELPNTEVDERIAEERHEALLNANPVPEGMGVARLVTAGHLKEQQLLQRQETRVQRPVDNRLFTWAAVGFNNAMAFRLLKKFLKASEYGADFMDTCC